MKTDIPPPSASRRLLAWCGFALCWLGAAVTGFQATVGDGPARPELATQSADSQWADPALEGRTVIREFSW